MPNTSYPIKGYEKCKKTKTKTKKPKIPVIYNPGNICKSIKWIKALIKKSLSLLPSLPLFLPSPSPNYNPSLGRSISIDTTISSISISIPQGSSMVYLYVNICICINTYIWYTKNKYRYLSYKYGYWIWYIFIYRIEGKKASRRGKKRKGMSLVSFQNQGIEWYPTEDPENPFSLTTTT